MSDKRERKERKQYSDDWACADDELEGGRLFSVEDKLESDKFNHNLVKEMNGNEVTLAFVQRYGIVNPILVRNKEGLGMKVPSKNFTVNDVRICVGSRRLVDVMDSSTQKNLGMTMKEWQRYYESEDKDRILNVISLEFTRTKLENYVESPTVVRQLDWVDRVWPKFYKDMQTESTNSLEDMMYPKVQKYVLMSVKGCYTDFHIDFGGTSVWYHILKGTKVFWVIPPTEKNIKLYENWILSGKQSDVFFGDMVEQCGRVVLRDGHTFFLPSGWIHAVYTLEDSLVFGGNFLHSFAIETQLRVAAVEDTTHVRQKYRYPFFTEMLWYVLARYAECVLGSHSLKVPIDDMDSDSEHCDRRSDEKAVIYKSVKKEYVNLTTQELYGLRAIVMYLHALPNNKKNVPDLLVNVIKLIHDVRDIVEIHRHDDKELAVTGKPVLLWNDEDEYGMPKVKAIDKALNRMALHKNKSKPRGGSTKGKRRRTRCQKCEACLREDCGECGFCHDMVKFGGQGRAKQSCILRQCLQPMLPVSSVCKVCDKDGWGRAAHSNQKLSSNDESTLMECSVCWVIMHPSCARLQCPEVEGIVNEDLPNSWECPTCCKDGKNMDAKPRHFRARNKVLHSVRSEGSGDPNMRDEYDESFSPKRKLDEDDDDDDDELGRYEYERCDKRLSAAKRKHSDLRQDDGDESLQGLEDDSSSPRVKAESLTSEDDSNSKEEPGLGRRLELEVGEKMSMIN